MTKFPKLFFRGRSPLATFLKTRRNYRKMGFGAIVAFLGAANAGALHASGRA